MKTSTKKYHSISMSLINIAFMTAIICVVFGCHKDDGPDIETINPIEEQGIFGKWKTQGTIFHFEQAKFIIVNDDFSIDVLSKDELGFRRIYKGYQVVSDEEIELNYSLKLGSSYRYALNGNQLTIVNIKDDSEVLLSRDNNAPSTNTWVKTLNIIDQAEAPWNKNVDIGFNGSKILFANGGPGTGNIGLVNPNTLSLEGEIETDIHTYVIEAEKSNGPDQLYFQSEGDMSISAYLVPADDTRWQFISPDFGVLPEKFLPGIGSSAAIRGLAVTKNKTIWVSNEYTSELFLYDYSGSDSILSQIKLDFQPYGLDFQDGFLYVSDGRLLHKCQTTPSFRAVESYKIPGHQIYGIAFDGSNFVVNTQKLPENGIPIYSGIETDNRLLRIDLSI